MKSKIISTGRIIKTGARNFTRNLWLAIAAMAVMIVTLTIILFALVANATFNHTITNITNKIDISVYLRDSVTTDQKNHLVKHLRGMPDVRRVEYLSKNQALENYKQQNAGDKQLQQAINETDNPIPATIHIKPYDLSRIGNIKHYLNEKDAAKLQSNPPSYSGQRKQAIDNISHATDVLREVGVIAVVVFVVISVLIIFNTIQMAIFNRRDELRIMRLLGANTWYIRGPFVVESVIYGIVSALVSVLLIDAMFVTARSALQASSLGLLDIHFSESYFDSHIIILLLVQLAIGILIGAVSSVIATRRYLKFKSSK